MVGVQNLQDIFPLTVPWTSCISWEVTKQLSLPRTQGQCHTPPLCITFYHHLKCPSPVPCMAKYYLFLKVLLKYQLLLEASLRPDAPTSLLHCPNWIGPRECFALCTLFRSLSTTVVLLIHFAWVCLWAKYSNSHMNLQNLASAWYIVNTQWRLNAWINGCDDFNRNQV